MRALKAHVKAGRIVTDDSVDLPDGTEIEVVALHDGITPQERAEIEAMVEESEREFDAGLGLSEEQFWAEFRAHQK